MGPRHHLSFCAYKTATFGPELQVSIGPDLTCGFVHAKQLDFHDSKTPPVDFPCKTATYGPE